MTTQPRFTLSGTGFFTERKDGLPLTVQMQITDSLGVTPHLSAICHSVADTQEMKKIVAILNAMPPIVETQGDYHNPDRRTTEEKARNNHK